ncbi:hypothetical protein [Bacillus sp. SM2101]|uniref:hypothetical protein n=1 Tax=Bacillus sp. SM2101 TaxID=2805366 RepID=UPI001BDDDC0C|nr:hypothetical protein [Bacillus sp. SM2101]
MNKLLITLKGVFRMLDTIDWKLISFVSYTLFHEYVTYIRIPQICYWENAKQDAIRKE